MWLLILLSIIFRITISTCY